MALQSCAVYNCEMYYRLENATLAGGLILDFFPISMSVKRQEQGRESIPNSNMFQSRPICRLGYQGSGPVTVVHIRNCHDDRVSACFDSACSLEECSRWKRSKINSYKDHFRYGDFTPKTALCRTMSIVLG